MSEGRRKKEKKRAIMPPSSSARSSVSSVERLFQRVDEHVRPGEGLSNDVVDSFCTAGCGKDFRGVFSADCIPEKLAARGCFIIVVNLGRRKGRTAKKLPVGHFVTIYARPASVYYLDPYGLPCVQRHVRRFLQHCRRPINHNSRQIQDFNSVYCGMYAILFTLYFDRGERVRKRLQFRWRRSKLRENDKLCMRYLNRLLSSK